jgi:hypothetical protein
MVKTPKAMDLRRFLLSVVHDEDGRLVTYGEVGRAIDHPANLLTAYLDDVAHDCESRREPDLTMLVVNSQTGVPSKFRWRLVENGEIDREDWMREVQRVRRHNWGDAALPS